jgi:hypothetical protein
LRRMASSTFMVSLLLIICSYSEMWEMCDGVGSIAETVGSVARERRIWHSCLSHLLYRNTL